MLWDRIIIWLKHGFIDIYKLFLTVLLLFGIIAFFYLQSVHKLKDISVEKEQLEDSIAALEESIYEAKQSLALWDNAQLVHTKRNGIDFETAEDLIHSAKLKYNLIDLKIDMSVPKMRKDFSLNKYTSIEMTNLRIKFYTIKDFDAFAFVNEFMNNVPGNIQIEEMHFKVLEDINADTLKAIEQGTLKKVMSMDVLFIWQNIVDMNKEAQDATSQ